MNIKTRLQLCFSICFINGFSANLLHHMNYDNIEDYKNHPCKRKCEDDTKPMTCDYNFLVEVYHTLSKACWDCPHNPESCSRPHCVSADGGIRGIITANRMLPGPAIHVCEHDVIRVRVHNKMEGSQATSIHWHGILQRGTPYMDGVSMVTQCPIPAHTAFTYVFNASTPGTHFWHGHAGLQRADGLFGHLVVRQAPRNEPHNGSYDYDLPEHTILVNDWWHRNSDSSFAHHHHSNGSNKPRSVLINGRGMNVFVYNSKMKSNSSTPRETFTVKSGYRYRFRVVSNGILNCPLRFSVDDHMMEVIATDGSPIEPIQVESFNIFAGERFDFILTANQTPDNYLVRVQGELDCGANFENAHETAILHYQGASEGMEFNNTFFKVAPTLVGLILNPINSGATNNSILISNLRSRAAADDDNATLIRNPDKKMFIAMDFSVTDNPRFHNHQFYSTRDFTIGNMQLQTPQMNGITSMMPPAPPLSQMHDIPKEMFCNKEIVGKDCSKDFCECIHIYHIKLGEVVEIVLVDQGHIWNASHPTHLHGHGFRVLALDKIASSVNVSDVMAMDEQGKIIRNLDRPPVKDTVTAPDGGYAVIRFHANNPGVWFLHCHIEYHVEIGMGLLFQVGELSQFPPVPANFPTCGSWEPDNDIQAKTNSRQKETKTNMSATFPASFCHILIIVTYYIITL